MVFNTTFNNSSVISWRSVLLVEETGVPGKTTDIVAVRFIGEGNRSTRKKTPTSRKSLANFTT
jgi:hypothetical protein